MSLSSRIERTLQSAMDGATLGAPPAFAAALAHAVFPGGARARPALCLAVAAACGDPLPPLADAAAAAVELLHAASLVHDDLPCFDDASLRRGRPTVHAAHGEALAVLAGDALIVMAFDVAARAASYDSARAARIVAALARGVSTPHGVIAGQAWESEPSIPASPYRRAKTGALFVAAAVSGAIAAGVDPAPWRAFADRVGEAYQVADDIDDVIGDAAAIGKPVGRDAALARPNTASDLGVYGARQLAERLLHESAEAIPSCPHPEPVRAWLGELTTRLLPTNRALGERAPSAATLGGPWAIPEA